ncbi:hypothetical protein niasHT_025840 [Heterodera trifolii]|uniref:Uncharacterized protein n=1 Tax=Heterodera trifolii TaxID=157864 RepID=A0ABD2KJ31_9BILA
MYELSGGGCTNWAVFAPIEETVCSAVMLVVNKQQQPASSSPSPSHLLFIIIITSRVWTMRPLRASFAPAPLILVTIIATIDEVEDERPARHCEPSPTHLSPRQEIFLVRMRRKRGGPAMRLLLLLLAVAHHHLTNTTMNGGGWRGRGLGKRRQWVCHHHRLISKMARHTLVMMMMGVSGELDCCGLVVVHIIGRGDAPPCIRALSTTRRYKSHLSSTPPALRSPQIHADICCWQCLGDEEA